MKINPKKTSLRGLRLFCVAAKYRNYTLAAEELSVTSSAVSHQVKSLEEELGLELFTRERRYLRLTEKGARLFRELEPVIAKIDSIIAAAQSKVAASQLRVSVQSFFASECFVPQLEDFTEKNPGTEIFVDTSRPEAWKIWSRPTGITLPPATSVVRLDSMIAVARAAERGVGAALVPVPLSDN